MSESAKEVRLPELDDQCFLELSELRADGTDNIDRERTVHHCRERQLRSALRQFHTVLQYLAQKDARIAELEDALARTKEEATFIARGMVNDLTELDRALAAEKARHEVTQKALERLSKSIITKAGLGNLLHKREGGKP